MPDQRFPFLTLAFMILAIGLLPEVASACPFCNGGPTGVNEVKAGIFNERFWLHAAVVLVPFPVLGGIVAIIYFWPRKIQRTPSLR